MSSNVVKCLKDWFSVRKTCRENKVMVYRGRAKKPARVQGGGLCRAEGAEVPVFSWGGFFIRHCRFCPYAPRFLPDLWRYKGCLLYFH